MLRERAGGSAWFDSVGARGLKVKPRAPLASSPLFLPSWPRRPMFVGRRGLALSGWHRLLLTTMLLLTSIVGLAGAPCDLSCEDAAARFCFCVSSDVPSFFRGRSLFLRRPKRPGEVLTPIRTFWVAYRLPWLHPDPWRVPQATPEPRPFCVRCAWIPRSNLGVPWTHSAHSDRPPFRESCVWPHILLSGDGGDGVSTPPSSLNGRI